MPTFITTLLIAPIILTIIAYRVIPATYASTVATYVYMTVAAILLGSIFKMSVPPEGWGVVALLGAAAYGFAAVVAVVVGTGFDCGFQLPWSRAAQQR